MDLQLDTEIRSVLELVRSSLRTNGTPLENAIQELRRVTESAKNATDTYHSKRLLDEKLKHPLKPVIPARKALKHRSPSKVKFKGAAKGRQSKRLERSKRQLEDEIISALYETSRLRQELRKEKRALAKERSENARKSLEIDLLRNDNKSAHQNLNESKTALKEAQERCLELEASLRSQNEATHAAQDLYTEESPITLDESFDEAGDLGDMIPSTPCSPVGNKSHEYDQNIATPPPSQKRRSSIRTAAATPPETPVAGPSNSIILLADCFPVVEDENFDPETEEIMINHLKSDRVLGASKNS
ncbi:hypothetical protein FNYG_08682 [Fusarium nygamai]|uniref:Uncharacterized protein n=1 Tax=Gibberella nygamai TaxID=42673 RepID=A0A2K0W6S1_GIBNY|nr:hypothetical protein FNYG_08682 [Fusarium nygamai]